MVKFILRLTWTIGFSILISGAGILFADCPEGTRATTDVEQQNYAADMRMLNAALPKPPEGWELQPVKFFANAPTSVCKGSKPVASIDATYISLVEKKQNEERDRQYESKITALQKLSPEEQRESDALYHQGSELGYKSIAALKNKDQAESDRLRAEANKAYAASKAIQQAHLQNVLPQIRAIQNEQRDGYVSPEVRVRLMVHDLAQDQKTVKTESARIEGVARAYYTPDKTLTILLGPSASGQPVWAQLQGNRKQIESVASLLGHSAAAATVASK